MTASQQHLLQAARAGDKEAFRRIIEPRRGELLTHCYRMLGSLHDAEDALQDALLRAWRGLSRLERRGSLGSWLYKVTTNVCLDALARRPKRVLPLDYGPPADRQADSGEPLRQSLSLEPYTDELLGVEDGRAAPEAFYEQRETMELAFIAAFQHLPARQRAVLILREVLAFSASEVAELLDTTAASVNSALQRARRSIEERLSDHSQQATLCALDDERIREIVERFIEAFENADVQAIARMLADDATFEMAAYPTWSHGRDSVGNSWLMPTERRTDLRYIPTRANGQLALGSYKLPPRWIATADRAQGDLLAR